MTTCILTEITSRQMQELLYQDLSPRERLIFSLRAGLNEEGEVTTLEEIGKRLHITRERVRQIEERARKKIICQWQEYLKKPYPEISIHKKLKKRKQGRKTFTSKIGERRIKNLDTNVGMHQHAEENCKSE